MRLIGVEFKNFARFRSCFVPLDTGLTILVGTNNSGKTALLRGLSTLRALPFRGRKIEMPRELFGYLPAPGDSNSFDMVVWFESDQSDPSPLRGSEGDWRSLVAREKPRVGFVFRVWPESAVVLESAEMRLKERSLPLLRRTGDGQMVMSIYNTSCEAVDSNAWPMPESQRAPDGRPYQLHVTDGLLSGFGSIRTVQAVDGHRFVRSNLGLASLQKLSSNAEDLAPFLQTLQGRERPQFQQIEGFVTKVFPQFRYVNPENVGNQVVISLTLRTNGTKVPLSHCGAGVEQILALATFVVTCPKGTSILLDEPHTYLHPSAERELVRYLLDHAEHRYVIATHSPILINSVTPNRILHLSLESDEIHPGDGGPSPAEILGLLGYRNSDLLFHDRLIFVEGESDQEIVPILLRNCGKLDPLAIEKTGFPVTEGSDFKKATSKQTVILRYERMLQELGRANIPRVYLRDGDAAADERSTLLGTSNPSTGRPLNICFLAKTEIENYLLVPEAIAEAIKRQATSEEVKPDDVSIEAIQTMIPDKPDVKGSHVLEAIFAKYGLTFSKRSSGRLIATFVNRTNQPALNELIELVEGIF